MYRPRGKPCEPAPHRAPGRSNRQRAALKRGEPAGKPKTERWTRPPLFLCWEASDQRKQETPLKRVAFLAFAHEVIFGHFAGSRGHVAKQLLPLTATCHGRVFNVVSDLPIKRLMRATRVWGRASSPRSKHNIVRQFDCGQAVRGESSHREGHHLRKEGPRRVESGGRMGLMINSSA